MGILFKILPTVKIFYWEQQQGEMYQGGFTLIKPTLKYFCLKKNWKEKMETHS